MCTSRFPHPLSVSEAEYYMFLGWVDQLLALVKKHFSGDVLPSIAFAFVSSRAFELCYCG